ncbi:MAG TPA: DNA replication/repair protein RecF [Microbacteriaceae bacterium]|nr:DNA replication/repair protein RecF [Microbacteriaceae bacterium]
MQINYLSLNNFRNYSFAEFDFKPGFNLLLGANGQGKTNAVESIVFLATQTSHRTSSHKALIQQGFEEAIVRAKLSNEGREALIEAKVLEKGSNKYFLNKQSVTGREVQQVLNAVIFAPEDLQIVRGDPSVRRSFIDQILISRYPAAVTSLSEYERAIRHKSSLLKSLRYSQVSDNLQQTLSLWNEKIVELGAQIVFYRHQVISDLKPFVSDAYLKIAGSDHSPKITMKESHRNVSRETKGSLVEGSEDVVSRETIRRSMEQRLQEVATDELDKGQCLVGPHRDDLSFYLNDLPVKGYASHGETWSFVLSLKLGVARLFSEESLSGDPVIILDDVFAELDRNRQQRLVSEISSFQQVIVTAAVADDVPKSIEKNVFIIHEGEVTRSE